MMIRNFYESDIEDLKRIHRQYETEFNITEFDSDNFVALFTAVEDNKVISTGGLRLIPEILLVTDKEVLPKIRREALLNILQASEFVAKRNKYKQIHAFVQDEKWLKQLLKHNFRLTSGKSVVFDMR